MNTCFFVSVFLLSFRLQEKAADTIESLHKAGMKVWVLTGDKMETAAATCYASKLFRRNTQILELTTKRTEEQSLHDVLFDLSRTVLRQHGGMTRDTFSGCVSLFNNRRTCIVLAECLFDMSFVCPVYQVTVRTTVWSSTGPPSPRWWGPPRRTPTQGTTKRSSSKSAATAAPCSAVEWRRSRKHRYKDGTRILFRRTGVRNIYGGRNLHKIINK